MAKFLKGLDLCESFFNECALPIIRRHHPDLQFSAGLMTAGSQILGYDDIVSTDHGWGPGFMLFLNERDMRLRDELLDIFVKNLSLDHEWFRAHYSSPDNGLRYAEFMASGHVASGIWICTIDEVIDGYIRGMPQSDMEWLAISEHRLLGLTAGKLFIDMLNISEVRAKLSFYPRDVKLYLIASQWSVIAEEQAFVKRTGDRGDELGSRIICARIAERLMRLCFLYKDRYAPYSKWFGTAFKRLSVGNIHDEIDAALSANTITER